MGQKYCFVSGCLSQSANKEDKSVCAPKININSHCMRTYTAFLQLVYKRIPELETQLLVLCSYKTVIRAQRLINLEISVLVQSLKSSNVELN